MTKEEEKKEEEKGLDGGKMDGGIMKSEIFIPKQLNRFPLQVKPEARTGMLQELPPQYILVNRCTKFVFAPITALAFTLSLIFYLYANIGMAVSLIGIGITSLLLTILFTVTKSALKE